MRVRVPPRAQRSDMLFDGINQSPWIQEENNSFQKLYLVFLFISKRLRDPTEEEIKSGERILWMVETPL